MQRQEQSLNARNTATVRIPLWLVPGSHGRFSSKNLAAFYYQFGTMIQAGVPIRRTLGTLQGSAPHPMRPTVARLFSWVEDGRPLHEALGQFGNQFADLDRHLISVGEQTGALDTALLSLGRYYEERAKARNRILSASMFPGLLLVAAVFISRFPALVLGAVGSTPYTMTDYARDTFGFLVLLAIVGFVGSWVVKSLLRMPTASVPVDRMLRSFPVFGALRFDYALSQWLTSIRLLLNAGYGIVAAMEKACDLVPSPLIAHGCKQALAFVREGVDVSQALRATGIFPEPLLQFWATGEESGRMDEMLDRLAAHYQERWQKSLAILTAWLPRIAYAFVGVFIIFQIAKLLGPLIAAYSEALQ